MPVRRLAPLLGAIALGAAALAVPLARASAQTNLIRNASFEENVLAVGQFRAPVTQWDAFLGNDSYGSYRPTNYSYLDGAPHGNNVLFLNPGVGIQQTLEAVVRPSLTYDLAYLVGQRADVLGGAYSVELLAGSTVVARDSASLAPAAGTFTPGRLSFVAPALGELLGQLLQIRVASTGDGQPNFDSFSLLTEPDPWIPIRNASFEVNALSEGQFRAPVTGWDAYIGVESYGSYHPTNYSYADGAPDGDNVLFLNPGAGIRQTLDAVLLPDATYTLSYLWGQRADVQGGPFEVALFAGASLLASQTTHVLPTPGSFLPGQLTVSSRGFESLLGDSLQLRVRSIGEGQPNLDAFSLRVDPMMTSAQTIAPEPRTLALLALGFAALVPLVRRRDRHAARQRDRSGARSRARSAAVSTSNDAPGSGTAVTAPA